MSEAEFKIMDSGFLVEKILRHFFPQGKKLEHSSGQNIVDNMVVTGKDVNTAKPGQGSRNLCHRQYGEIRLNSVEF